MRQSIGLTSEDVGVWGQFVTRRNTHTYVRGTQLYTPEQPASELMLLSRGQIGLHLMSDEGRALTVRVVEPGELFGHMALAEQGIYDTYAEAITPVTLHRISRAEVQAQVERDPALGLALAEDMLCHRQTVSHLFDEVAFKSVPARLASLLLDLAESDGGTQPSRVARRSHRQLAERINAYRETVTKVINQFRAAHLLEIDHSFITLLNPRGLEELAQG